MNISIAMLLASHHENLCRLAHSLGISSEGVEHNELAWFVMNGIQEDKRRANTARFEKMFE